VGVYTATGGLFSLKGDALNTMLPGTSTGFLERVVVSPDGSRFAWLEAGNPAFQLRVQPVGSAAQPVGPSTILYDFQPVWSADGSTLLVRYNSGWGQVNATSGVLTPMLANVGDNYAFSPDFVYAAWRDTATGENVIYKPGGSGSVMPLVEPSGKYYGQVGTLSPDGKHAFVWLMDDGEPQGEPGRTVSANALVNLTTGASVDIPGGGTMRQGFFRADGTAIVRMTVGSADRVLLVSPTFTVLASRDLPPSVAELTLIGYRT
jgi:hypothetical protein